MKSTPKKDFTKVSSNGLIDVKSKNINNQFKIGQGDNVNNFNGSKRLNVETINDSQNGKNDVDFYGTGQGQSLDFTQSIDQTTNNTFKTHKSVQLVNEQMMSSATKTKKRNSKRKSVETSLDKEGGHVMSEESRFGYAVDARNEVYTDQNRFSINK